MSVRFFDVWTKTDWFKLGFLIVLATVTWSLVWREYQKPLVDPGIDIEVKAHPAVQPQSGRCSPHTLAACNIRKL